MSDTRPYQTEDPYALLEQYLSGIFPQSQSSGVDQPIAPKKCELCGASVFEDSRNGLSHYCPRHGHIIARVQGLMEDKDPTEGETRMILAQAEAEADKMFGVKADDHRELNGEVSTRRESRTRSLSAPDTRRRQELKYERQPRSPAIRINKGTVGTVLAILVVGVVIPLLGLNLFLSSVDFSICQQNPELRVGYLVHHVSISRGRPLIRRASPRCNVMVMFIEDLKKHESNLAATHT